MFCAICDRMAVSPCEKMSPEAVNTYAAKKKRKSAATSAAARMRDRPKGDKGGEATANNTSTWK
ncbi:MAG: hypothetical protein NVS2B16_06350 [Chloroflexota bacterium]